MRGNLSASFAFPVDAEYEIRFRVMNLRNANGNNQTYLDVVNGKASAVGNFDEDAGVPGAAGAGQAVAPQAVARQAREAEEEPEEDAARKKSSPQSKKPASPPRLSK